MKAIISTELEKRIADDYGFGHFGAPRGERTHSGQDYLIPPEVQVEAPVAGKIVKNGYAYNDDLSFRYVRIEKRNGELHDIFYIEPILPEGREVKKGAVIGFSQDLTERYPGIGNHIHYQIKVDGTYVDPETYGEKV